jgi:hypothetical protein
LVTAALKIKREQLKSKFKDELQKLYEWDRSSLVPWSCNIHKSSTGVEQNAPIWMCIMVLETVASLSLGGRELAFASSKSCQTKLPF